MPLKIRQIVLENFKSYEGRHVIGPFHDKFTCIIGPNGSGKSNLIDSLLFVFGKRARWMRAQQLHQLIHSSSHCTEASVEVQFQENDDCLFSIRRVVFHTSISKYEIDGVETTQEQVVNLLKKKGIDLQNNRFLVLQGEIDQIFLMKSKSGHRDSPGLLEYLEEVIGTMDLKESMDDIHKQLTELEEKRFEYGERVQVSRSTLEQIYPLVREALMQVVIRIKNMVQMNEQIQIAIYKKQKRLKEDEKEISSKEEQLDEFMGEKYKLERKERQLQDQLEELKENRKQQEEELVKVHNELQIQQEKCSALNEEINLFEVRIEKVEKKIKELEDEKQSIQDETKEMREIKPSKDKQLAQLSNQKEILEQKQRILSEQMQSKKKELLVQKNEIEALLYPYLTELKQLETKYNNLNIENSIDEQQVLNEHRSLDGKGFQLNQQCQEISMVIEKFSDIFQKMKLDKDQLQEQIREFEKQINEKQMRVNTINQELEQNQDHLQESTSRQKLVKQLFQAKRDKLIPNIYGCLGDLGTIDEKYQLAITVACPALDHIVVDTQDDAIKIIEYLKLKQLGRLTFLPLDRIPQEVDVYLNKQFETPSQSKRLFDLIRVKDSKFLGIFYSVLRDTLVCDNIEIATEIAFKGKYRKRVATIDGKLIEITGLMSGGGLAKNLKSRMSSKFKNELSKEQVHYMSQERKQLITEMSQIKEQIDQNDQQLQELLLDEHQAKGRYKQKLVDLEIIKDQIKENEEKLKYANDQLQEYKHNEIERQEKMEKRQRVKKKMELIKQKIAEDENKLKDIDENILNCSDLGQRQQFSKITKQYDELENECHKINAQLLNADKKIESIDDTLQQYLQSLEDTQEKLEKSNQKKKQLDQYSYQLIVKEGKLKQTLTDWEQKNILSQLKTNTNQLQDLIKQINHIQKEIETLQTECNMYHKFIISESAKLEELKKDYSMFIKNYHYDPSVKDDDLSYTALFSKCYSKSGIPEFFPQLPTLEDLWKYDDDFDELQIEQHIDTTLLMEYEMRSKEYTTKLNLLSEMTSSYDKLKQQYDLIRTERKTVFENAFKLISTQLKQIYQLISAGGDADLDIIDKLDPFSEGLTLLIKPKSKTWKPLHKLSGGEKTLASLSLLLSLHSYKPSPLYFFDEIDAALDHLNVSIIANHIVSQSSAQFIVISLRSNMYHQSNKLIGIYKLRECTYSLPFNPNHCRTQMNRQINNKK